MAEKGPTGTARGGAGTGTGRWVSVLLRCWRGGKREPRKPGRGPVHFKVTYDHFREILALNDTTHQLIADVEDKLQGRTPFVLDTMVQKVRKGMLDVLIMVKDLNQIGENRFVRLYDVLGQLNREFEGECANLSQTVTGPTVIPISELKAADSPFAGTKMASLGEVRNRVGLDVPDGFVVTTAAFMKFMTHGELWERAGQLNRLLDMYGTLAVDRASREVQEAILRSPMPPEVEEAILKAYNELAAGSEVLVAIRSSAVGEDRTASHAGQYYTELNVPRELLIDAYRTVLASCYRPDAVWYRYERGLTEQEAFMAVGCIRMVQPRCSGLLFSRDFRDLGADRVEVNIVEGLSENMVRGEANPEQFLLGPGDVPPPGRTCLSAKETARLFQAARRLEAHFEGPQDIEWALDAEGRLFILQTRPMAAARPAAKVMPALAVTEPALLEGGNTACPGAGSGPVFLIRDDRDLERFPQGAVAVARHSSPSFSRIMTRASAIVTDVGSPIGHMAILAREFGVPAVVGMAGAVKTLAPAGGGAPAGIVTVDATACRVYEGAITVERGEGEASSPLASSPAVEFLRRVARLVTPLRLIDPASPEFAPSGCRSLHDVTRFVHEKVYEVMFRVGEKAMSTGSQFLKLEANLPIDIRVIDVGNGLVEGARPEGLLRQAEIVSLPMKAFMEGLQDERIRWNQPRPVSARGFLSVVGQTMAGPPPEASSLGSVSYVVMSDRYMNFSTKAGYHFSTVDTYCGKSQNKNYIHFRFVGGGASNDRRARRVRFLLEVLSKLDFKVQTRGDLLMAQFEKYEQEVILERLTRLGRLTLCSRQLDMLMDNDGSALFFAQAFLNGEWQRF